MTAILTFLGFAIVIGILQQIEKNSRSHKEQSLEDYLFSETGKHLDERLAELEMDAEENGVGLNEEFDGSPTVASNERTNITPLLEHLTGLSEIGSEEELDIFIKAWRKRIEENGDKPLQMDELSAIMKSIKKKKESNEADSP